MTSLLCSLSPWLKKTLALWIYALVYLSKRKVCTTLWYMNAVRYLLFPDLFLWQSTSSKNRRDRNILFPLKSWSEPRVHRKNLKKLSCILKLLCQLYFTWYTVDVHRKGQTEKMQSRKKKWSQLHRFQEDTCMDGIAQWHRMHNCKWTIANCYRSIERFLKSMLIKSFHKMLESLDMLA